jgi:tRNA(Ile)-lysidine synthase
MLFLFVLRKFERLNTWRMLFKRFKSYVQDHKLLNADSNILLAVSGGVDSMTMLHLFYRYGVKCSVAHCNFSLRGEESDEDEAFVGRQTSNLSIPLFVTRFDTIAYARENRLSIQMAARELRYIWFDKLAQTNHFDFIAVAHNRDDILETFFINLGRGSGLAGLTGIKPMTENIIRPLLFASRAEINQYSKENQISFREDSSNESDKYQRNYIRHKVIPMFEEIFPHFRESQVHNLERLTDAYALYQHALQLIIPSLTSEVENRLHIQISTLLQTPAPKTVLFEILRKYGFTSSMMDEIYALTDAPSGKQILSSTHKLVKDRISFIVSKIEPETQKRFYIEEGTTSIHHPISLTLELIERTEGFNIEKNSNIALLDYAKLAFPLILRKWQAGDYFAPLGMKGLKKLSDFFVDVKFSIAEKENTWLLTSGDQIVWIIGNRIDDRFKIMETTRTIVRIVKV